MKAVRTTRRKITSSTPTTQAELEPVLLSIHSELRRHNSLGWSFMRGLITGIGTSVGVTVVFAVIVYILTLIARALGLDTAVQSILDSLGLFSS